MKRLLAAALALAGGVVTLQAPAQAEQMRPGLWEYNFTARSQSGEMEKAMEQMQQQLASMPPEQRKMMEQMMAGQGMQLGSSVQTVRICVSEEKAARGIVPQQDGDCRQEIVERSGSTTRFTFNCPGNPPSSGEGEITFSSPTAYTGKSIVNTTVNGKPERMTMEQTGKWISSDCGNLRAR
jgi:hypothetical protein